MLMTLLMTLLIFLLMILLMTLLIILLMLMDILFELRNTVMLAVFKSNGGVHLLKSFDGKIMCRTDI